MTRRGEAEAAPAARRSWLLAVPLAAAAAAVLWTFVGSSLFGPTAGAGPGVLDGEGDLEGDPEAAAATLAGSNRPVREKPAMKEEEEPAKPTFTKAEGFFGRVTDSREKPIPGAKVSLFLPDPSNPWSPADGALLAAAEAAADGTYLVGPAPVGRLRLRAEASGYASTSMNVSSRGAKVDLILDRSGALRVKVKTRKGEAIKDADVGVSAGWMFRAPPVKTNAEGEALVDGLASGPCTLRVTALGYGPVNMNDVQVEPAKTAERTVVMGKGVPVSGRVTDETTNAPIEGAEVMARVQWDQSGPRSDTVKTDGDGKFKLESAGGQGEWVEVRAKKEGYGEATTGVQLQGGGGGAGQEVELKLGKGGQAKGTVLDPDGRPVAGAKAMWLGIGWGTPAASMTATTDAEGAFALDLPPGTGKEWVYTIAATAQGKGLGAGQATHQQTGSRGATIRLMGVGSVSGKVNAPSGEGLEGASVTLAYDWNSKPPPGLPSDVQPWMYQQMFWDPRMLNLAATTDATGSFRIDDVPAANYRVQASWGLDRGAASEAVSVRPGGVETVKLEIGSGNTIEGKVTDQDGKAIYGAYVNGSDPINNRQGENRSAYARSDAEGRFILRGVLGERWNLNVQAAGFAHKQVTGVANGDKSVEVRMTPLGWITGLVQAEGQPFQGAFTVSIQSTTPRRGDEGRGRFRGMGWGGGGGREETFTSADGTFTLRGVESGSWKVNVTTQDNWIPMNTPEIAVTDGRGTDGVEVRMTKGAVLVGAVVEEGARTPISGAGINLRIRGAAASGGTTWAWAQTDAKGQFTAQGLATGVYTVSVNAPTGLSWEEDVRLEAGTTVQKDFVSQRWGSVRVTVLDAQGAPVSGAQVNLQTERGSWVQPNWDALRKEGLVDFNRPNAWESVTQTDAQGVNVRTHVSPGRIQVNVWARGQKAQPPVTWCVVASDQVTEVTVQYPAPPGEGGGG
jgi:protocatechuate 3,4-dioxygenase beta subunit